MKKRENSLTQQYSKPLGEPGMMAKYHHEREDEIPGSVVRIFTMNFGSVAERKGIDYQWLHLSATKANEERFSIWLLCREYPSQILSEARKTIVRYIFQEEDAVPLEFSNRFTGEAVLPILGAWQYLIPQAVEDMHTDGIFPQKVKYLGHTYSLYTLETTESVHEPPNAKVLKLLPDVLIGPAHNSKQKDETRRYDGSDYELVRLTKDDYDEMIDAGVNCLRVDAEQAKWIEHRDVFYWGMGGGEISYPECLYRSNYLGPSIFMDEPAVHTRDQIIRPRLEQDEEFRKILTPQIVFEEFQNYFGRAKYEGTPKSLIKSLAARPDVDLGDMDFLQQNIYTWETMVSSAICQLAEDIEGPPAAIVFEPPGRIGTLRTLPEINMTYGCQIPSDDPKNLADIIYGFLRGAARLADKSWGMSIYGQFDRADAFWFQTHAYDMGASFFLYWDTHELACVPYSEYLALSRNLMAHVASHPGRNWSKLKEAAEVAILFPPGYNLGHVHLGRGNLWGVGELNLERYNQKGCKYRVVMGNFFTEIERCIRLGVAYDLLWDLNGLDFSSYREVIRIREDGKVEVSENGKLVLHDGARTPVRPLGTSPQLTVELSTDEGEAPLEMIAHATITEGSSIVYYTLGADSQGVYRNDMILWELFGPGEEDYRFLNWERRKNRIRGNGPIYTAEIDFRIEQSGNYRLRSATVDMAGRTAVVWKTITVKE